jgi:acetyltransferase-like isoleucine patch superfamily enzyme
MPSSGAANRPVWGRTCEVQMYHPPVRRGRHTAGALFVAAYRGWSRVRAKAFSIASSGAFAAYGARSVLQPPIRLGGERYISVGSDVFVGAGSWLQVLGNAHSEPALLIGDGTSIAGSVVLSAARSVRIGRRVLIARNVYVSDHIHAYDDPTRAVLDQGLARIEPVEICDGGWVGENVVVCPGVRIGRGAVIGANAVVVNSIPDHSVAVGAPARVVRTLSEELHSVR